TASSLEAGASVGMTTTALQCATEAAQATAAAWLPAETVTRPRSRSATDSERTLLSAPRALKDPVFWKLSHLRDSRTPQRADNCAVEKTGVRCTRPAIRLAAARMSSIGITRGS